MGRTRPKKPNGAKGANALGGGILGKAAKIVIKLGLGQTPGLILQLFTVRSTGTVFKTTPSKFSESCEMFRNASSVTSPKAAVTSELSGSPKSQCNTPLS